MNENRIKMQYLSPCRPCRWRDILIEDLFVVEGIQKAVSPANMMTANSQL